MSGFHCYSFQSNNYYVPDWKRSDQNILTFSVLLKFQNIATDAGNRKRSPGRPGTAARRTRTTTNNSSSFEQFSAREPRGPVSDGRADTLQVFGAEVGDVRGQSAGAEQDTPVGDRARLDHHLQPCRSRVQPQNRIQVCGLLTCGMLMFGRF